MSDKTKVSTDIAKLKFDTVTWSGKNHKLAVCYFSDKGFIITFSSPLEYLIEHNSSNALESHNK
ncbi:hypothetical protein PSI22_09215 [Xenorhabdus sp. XENO-7]|uniref:Uncharacterized protein n=1 Tax=Xenorhabdus aichiensis TaxID=3025874 RepID=A0ABT5M2C2_9GAMM|nr:hypothetical protein [Xenorhabdus aichiensis]MDC9621809.1 hypothetical protein [Xenorhabdus aichiensis]